MAADWYEQEAHDDEEEDYSVKEYDITAAPNDFNIKTIFDFIESGAVRIPGFQRNYVWDIKRASKLIESIIIGLPIPQVFLYEESRNSFLVIDGQQRLMSIYYFMKLRFPRKEKRTDLRTIFAMHGRIPEEVLQDDKYFTKFNLQLPSALPDRTNKFARLNYSTLDEFKTTFDLRTIRNIIIKQNLPQEDDSSIYEVFNRLNSGGVNLTPQEIRSSLYHSKFYDLLYRLNLNPGWRKFIGVAEPDLHNKDIEILLRGFAMLMDGATYKPSMTRFLNNFSKRSKSLSAEMIEYLEGLFGAFIETCANLSNKAFYGKSTNKFNISVYESVFAAACAAAFQARSRQVHPVDPGKLELLKNDQEFINATQSSIASSANVRTRLDKAAQILLTA